MSLIVASGFHFIFKKHKHATFLKCGKSVTYYKDVHKPVTMYMLNLKFEPTQLESSRDCTPAQSKAILPAPRLPFVCPWMQKTYRTDHDSMDLATPLHTAK
jgi:hypothetical protein